MNIGLILPSEIPACRELFASSFLDGEDYLSAFFEQAFPQADTFVLRRNGSVCAMLSVFGVQMRQGTGFWHGGYIFGATTRPDCRRQGYMEQLLAFAGEDMAKKGGRFLCLVPQEAHLIDYYRKQGFVSEARLSSDWVQAGGEAEISPCTCAEFCRMRMDFLSGISGAVCLSESMQAFLYEDILRSDGKILKLRNKSGQSYAVCYTIKDKLYIRESSAAHDQPSAIPGFFGRSGAWMDRASEQGRIYGLCRFLYPASVQAYMNLMMD